MQVTCYWPAFKRFSRHYFENRGGPGNEAVTVKKNTKSLALLLLDPSPSQFLPSKETTNLRTSQFEIPGKKKSE